MTIVDERVNNSTVLSTKEELERMIRGASPPESVAMSTTHIQSSPAESSQSNCPTITIDPRACTTRPAGEVHADPKSKKGFVNFNATSPCTIIFEHNDVFNMSSLSLNQGNNKCFVQTEEGHTKITIKGCEDRMPRNLGAASGPTDIIVP